MMKLSELLRLVWINIMENKAKMMLTSLGIIVGAATIVLVIAIGRGGQADVEDQFKNLNAGAIDVVVGDGIDMDAMMAAGGMPGGAPPFMGGGSQNENRSRSGSRSSGGGMPGGMSGGMSGGMPGSMGGASSFNQEARLDADDVNDIATLIPNVKLATILQSSNIDVYGGVLDEAQEATVVGVESNYKDVSNLEVLYGDFISDANNENKDYVCVLGYSIAEEIFEYAYYAYGDYVEIEEKNYEVIGVLSSMGAVSSGISPDSAVFVPYETAGKSIFGNSADLKISAVASDIAQVEQVMEDIETVLTENHPGSSFDVSDAGGAMEAAAASANTLSLLLFAVATIVFIVGGIGIMNVLFVSVKERTSEIGLLKAIGCSRATILMEFLFEAGIISVIGGVLGVGVSFAIMPLVELFGVRMEPTAWGAVLALLFAVATGTIFGFYPAWKAAQLVPIEALNHE